MSVVEELSVYNETNQISSFFWDSCGKLWISNDNLMNFLLWISYAPLNLSPNVIVEYQPWIMSVLGSILIGLSGILPLLVIPLDETDSLKTGAGAKTLRMLLSFASGGLLGDVFLHLLPEAWGNHYLYSSNTKANQPSLTSGCWVLAGLLVFIIIEKVFSCKKEDEEEEIQILDNNGLNKSLSIRRKKSNFILKDLNVNCTVSPDILQSLASIDNNNVKKNELSDKKPFHISGYLNLVANSIDNFAHGLTVGGGFLRSTRVGIFSTLAILVHEIPHEVGDFAILLKAGFSRWDAARAQIYTASFGILGAFTALLFSVSASDVEANTSWILPFTAGGFLHIALVTVLPELLDEKNPKESLKQMGFLVSGITVMAVLSTVIEG